MVAENSVKFFLCKFDSIEQEDETAVEVRLSSSQTITSRCNVQRSSSIIYDSRLMGIAIRHKMLTGGVNVNFHPLTFFHIFEQAIQLHKSNFCFNK